MKAFHFGLERLLRLKGQELRQEVRRLMLARQEAAARKARRDLIAWRLEEARRQLGRGNRTAAEWALADRYIHEMRQRLREAETALAEAEARVEEARGPVLERNREKKALERLKTRRAERYAREAARREQNELDEVSLILRLPG